MRPATDRPLDHRQPHEETTVTEPFKQGSLVRTTKLTPNFAKSGSAKLVMTKPGFEFTVEEYISAEEAEDGTAFYWGSAQGGCNNVAAWASDIELVKTADEMAARRIPTVPEVVELISSALIGAEGVHETDRDGVSGVEVYARAENGLTYGFRVHVTDLWRTDD
jgi:hypothetical protein